MKNYSIKLPKLNSQEDFIQFVNEIDGELNNDTLHLSGNIAEGTIKLQHPDTGFFMTAWDVVFHSPVDLYKEIPPSYFPNNSYSIIYILTPSSVSINKIGEHPQYTCLNSRSSLLMADDLPVHFHIQAGEPVQLLYFNITTFWLRQQFINNEQSVFDLSKLTDSDKMLIDIEPCSSSIERVATSFFNDSINGDHDNEETREYPVLLVTECIGKKLNRDKERQRLVSSLYYKQMIEVEAILLAYLQSNLPTLKHIAKQVGLSVSTLKRKFKAAFGKSIYEYYLEKKMCLAKTLLAEQPLTINEAAEIFGYEKVSNFIDIFKKYHGSSPGKYKKSLALTH